MYSGIIKGKFKINSIDKKIGLVTLSVLLPKDLLLGLKIGDSVSVSGVCLTVKKINNDIVFFDAMQETLDKTTIGELEENNFVNIERSLKVGEENGGHGVYGHVMGTAKIINIENPENNHIVTFEVNKEWMKYLLPKGFVAIDGCSLTVSDPDFDSGTFKVWLIPETLERTTFSEKKIGERVNIELDHQTQSIVDTVERVLKNKNLV